ncbi:MAG: Cache 3/Cache 2 fusion domain-containing protein, partial [Bacteroidota bacterium]
MIIFAVLAVVIYRSQKSDIITNSDRRMYSQLEDLTNLLEIEYKYKQSSIEKALKVAANVITNRGEISASEATTILAIINQNTESKKIVEVPQWLIAGQIVQKNNALVDTIQKLTGSQTSIFQKIPDGYVRISTTEREASGAKSLLGYYLPNNDPIVQTIARGKKFEGRLNINNEWYITAYQPIRLDGEIAGMLYTGAKEKDLGYLRKKFKEKKYYNTGYPFAMTPEGEYIIHPILEGKDNQDPEFTAFVKKNKRGKYRYKYPDNKDGAWKLTYFTYYEPYDLIIGATLDENQILDRTLVGVKNTLVLG